MSKWPLSFIKRDEFYKHVKETIEKYGEKLQPYDLERFNRNVVDPIKVIFDRGVYQSSWEEIIKNEIFRQRDKSNSNDIGYFHQRIFQYMKNCEVPDMGWDVIYTNRAGINLDDAIVHTIYVEMKNKHNTMNSSSSAKTYMRMQNMILRNDDCGCFLVEVIARSSQNIKWRARVSNETLEHKQIRRVSIDQFYAMVTGEEDAFFRICMILPDVIEEIVKHSEEVRIPIDTVFSELKEISQTKNVSMALAFYLLGFNTYKGFSEL